MDTITTRIFIENVFLIMQRRNIPGITLENLQLAGKEFQELCKSKDVEADIRLSKEDFEDLLENSNVFEYEPGNSSFIKVKTGAILGRRYAEYLPLRATVALVMDLPKIVAMVCSNSHDKMPQMSAKTKPPRILIQEGVFLPFWS